MRRLCVELMLIFLCRLQSPDKRTGQSQSVTLLLKKPVPKFDWCSIKVLGLDSYTDESLILLTAFFTN